jgi:hypothetical protein
MTVIISGSDGIEFPDSSDQTTAATGFGFKNRIINGQMVLDQRNGGASVTPTDGQYVLDRWKQLQSVASKYSVQQNAGSVTPPVGFTNYLGVTSLSAYSVGAGDYFALLQEVEGFNIADLAWGTASASPVTVSFWVRSSLTGLFGGTFGNSSNNRAYPFTYTISSANTWEYKTVTIPGDTTGTWLTTNGIGLKVKFGLGVGSTYNGTAGSWQASNLISVTGATSVVGTNGATFYITGVQLEKGSTATSFDYRPYGTEFALCQRYCQRISADSTAVYARFGSGLVSFGGTGDVVVPLKTTMRTTPSLTTTGTASNYAILTSGGVANACNAVPSINTLGSSADVISMQPTTAAGMTAGQACHLVSNNTSAAYLIFNAEL